jgi:hypothetical protein
MTCRSFEELAAALCHPEGASVDAETRAEALAHAETCETCGLRLREEQRLGRGLAALAGATAAREAPPYVEAALRAAFRARAATAPRAGRIAPARTAAWRGLAAGLAAAAIVGIGLGLATRGPRRAGHDRIALGPSGASSDPRADSFAHAPAAAGPGTASTEGAGADSKPLAPATASTPEALGPRSRPARAHATRPASSAVRRDAARPSGRRESGPDRYVPWLWADPTMEFDRGHVVRVGVPRSALASWGWPVAGDVADESVEAELLLGEDGVARAIRVVR